MHGNISLPVTLVPLESRGCIISLKAKLTTNPRGSRSITAYLTDMRAIADDLALAQCPVTDEDLVVYVLTQLGEEYNSIISAVRVRETPISWGELVDILTDHERQLKVADDTRQSLLATANATQRTSSSWNNQQSNYGRKYHNDTANSSTNRTSWQQWGTHRPTVICKFCNFAGHETKASPPWLFDSGASHHATPSIKSLQTFSEYSGPDEVRLGDGNPLQISHISRIFERGFLYYGE
ncbi:PREDICTED: uncharacterized protein LOC109157319 [Ipomoea nil]|uniref:uncharacterized protein LOC109157319 n=1 Tax=Ipomoea nil TaxID=35883 RepID=UPI000901A927|nr:PREDICTED: uncharacterized protein LOC109157319 [Ipomoea nil]